MKVEQENIEEQPVCSIPTTSAKEEAIVHHEENSSAVLLTVSESHETKDGRDEESAASTTMNDVSEERESSALVEPKKASPPAVSRSNSITSNATKKRSKNNNSNKNNNNGGGSNPYPYPRQPWGGPYAPPPYGYPGGNGPYAPPPPHYSHPHHHAHPPPHPHMMPHPHYGGGYGGPPPHGGGGGNRGGNGNNNSNNNSSQYPPHHPAHHHPYSGGPPPYGMPYGMPPGYPPNAMQQSDCSTSVGSGKSKSSKTSQQRKRTIDGIIQTSASGDANMALPPSAYQFRRSDSNSSSTSTVTAGNNTSTTHHTVDTADNNESGRNRSSSNDFLYDNPNNNDNMQASRPSKNRGYHRRDYSGASTASSLSVGGFSLASYEGPRVGALDDAMMVDVNKSPKRHKTNSRGGHLDAVQSSRFEQLSMDDKRPTSTSSRSSNGDRNLFLSLSTSPINHATDQQPDVDATPISKNTAKLQARKDQVSADAAISGIFQSKPGSGPALLKLDTLSSEPDRPSDTPTPPVHGELGVHTDEQSLLNRHLRGQSFTPLPHLSNSGDSTTGVSPSNGAFASGIAPQLSWSIAGDTPSLGDLADWEEDNKSKGEKPRPSSTTSAETQGMLISPQDFQLWKEEHDLADGGLSGTTTPLPFFMDQAGGEGRENQMRMDQSSRMSQTSKKMGQHPHSHHGHHGHPGDPSQMHHFLNSLPRDHQGLKTFNKNNMHPMWNKHDMPPTPLFPSSEYRDDGFMRSPMDGGDRRDSMDFFAASHMFSHGHPNDRVRNLRGRVPPGSHLPPMPLHIPPPMSSHLPMTSPMGLGPGKGMGMGMWSPHHGMAPPMGSPHHMQSPLNSMAQSKRKCVPLKPPIPSKFQGNIEKTSKAQVPEFTSLVNFPAHMSQKQAGNLPEGIRCCVMCGSACPCSSGNKNKKGKVTDGGLAPRNNNGQDVVGDKSGGFAIIPTQNKGLCTLCDVNVWVVVTTALEIKWCKGCKNFRPWAAFGDKGLATKCLRCRERQREKYALQKEEKEKARMLVKAAKA